MKKVFDAISNNVMTAMLRSEPIRATAMGEHAFDGQLPDYTAAGRESLALKLGDYLTDLDAVDDLELTIEDQVDLEILRSAITRALFELREVKSVTWNPMVWNPGNGLHSLLSREFAPMIERLESARSRLA